MVVGVPEYRVYDDGIHNQIMWVHDRSYGSKWLYRKYLDKLKVNINTSFSSPVMSNFGEIPISNDYPVFIKLFCTDDGLRSTYVTDANCVDCTLDN